MERDDLMMVEVEILFFGKQNFQILILIFFSQECLFGKHIIFISLQTLTSNFFFFTTFQSNNDSPLFFINSNKI